jgi:acyl carrier protein
MVLHRHHHRVRHTFDPAQGRLDLAQFDALPLTPNGKVDRAGLPAPKFAELGVYVAPNTVHEHLVAMLFTEVLGVERVGLDDDFFALGGHSLLATQLMARIRERFGIDLPLRTLFEEPGLRELAARVEQAEAEQTDGAALDDLERLLSEVESMNDETAQRLAMDETERDSVVDGMVGNGKILDTEGEK